MPLAHAESVGDDSYSVAVSTTSCNRTGTVVGLDPAAGGLLNVRLGPGRQFKSVDQVQLGQSIAVCELNGDWAGIRYNGATTGWVSKRFIAGVPTVVTNEQANPKIKSVANSESSPHPEWSGAFARRNFKLGMTINQFRNEPYPDQQEVSNAYVVCSDDKLSRDSNYFESGTAEAFKTAGVTKCMHYHKLNMSSLQMVSAAGLGLGNDRLSTEFYFIAPEGETEKRLFWVETRGPTDSVDILLPAFLKAYGDPAVSRSEPWQNKAGATFDNAIRIWKNEVSEIELRRLGSTVNSFELEHRLLPLMALFNKRLDDQSADAAKRL